jgi:uncharacterized membrane-anchored protein
MRKKIALVAGLIVLVIANYTIYSREQLLTDGRVVLLQLAPVDPRSLMQGNYMALRFHVANAAFGFGDVKENVQDGHIVLALDTHRVGTFRRFDDGSPLPDDEVRMRYRIRNRRPQFATNAFFFQEGEAELYTTARYGEFRVGADGEAILTELWDEDFKLLGNARSV